MRILLIEDDTALCCFLSRSLEKQGFSVTVCHDGEDGLFHMLENAHDLALLDCMLPGMDGGTLLKKARAKHINMPVIFLTALGSLKDRVSGLDAGADDYIVKPFEFEELMARIRSVTRRPHFLIENNRLICNDLEFLPDICRLSSGDETCTLSRREGDLLSFLLRNAGQILPRSAILGRVWGADSDVESGNLDNYIHFLRRRLKSVGSGVEIRTIRGIGYQLISSDENDSSHPDAEKLYSRG